MTIVSLKSLREYCGSNITPHVVDSLIVSDIDGIVSGRISLLLCQFVCAFIAAYWVGMLVLVFCPICSFKFN